MKLDFTFKIENTEALPPLHEFSDRSVDSLLFGFKLSKADSFVEELAIDF